LERSQIKAPETGQELPGDVIYLEENDLEEADIPEIPSIQEAHPWTETRPACTATEYIVYAPSFQVPAFYFTISDSGQLLRSSLVVGWMTPLADGSPLSLDRLVQTNLFKLDVLAGASVQETHIEPRASTLPLNQERGAVFPLLSQGDHPTLQIPCWYFHPCETGVAVGELLAFGMQSTAERRTLCHWLEAWMAMLGTVINLRA
jgi:ubiquitin-like-conjugating enzyme ATG10